MISLTAEEIQDLFFHRKDVFAQQRKSGGYFPVKRPVTIKDIEKHLRGEITLGAYCLDTDNTVRWACVDIDGDEENVKSLLTESLVIYNVFPEFPRMLEESGRRGYHIWIFFKNPSQAKYVQRLVKARLNRIDMNKHEVFPKQTELNKDRLYGNLVKIPYALHRKSGKFSKIIKTDKLQAVLKQKLYK